MQYATSKSLALKRRPSQLAIEKKKPSGSDAEGEIQVEKQLTRQLSGEIAMSLVAPDKYKRIGELLSSNPQVATELYEMIQKDSIDAMMEELLQESFMKRHNVNGKKYKAHVIKKEDFEKLGADVRDESLSDAVIAALEPVVCLAPDETDFYQVKLLEALLVEVQNKCGDQNWITDFSDCISLILK